MNSSQVLAAITPVIEVFDQLGVLYHIGGSVASSIYGILRATIDADLIADLRLEHVRPLVTQLQTDYYIDEDMIRDAIRRRSSFNVIHLDTMLKVDVYIPKFRSFDQEELRRAQQEVLLEGTRLFNVADILGVLKIQGTNLDMDYLKKWSANLNVTDLLERALVDAGLKD